MKIGKIVLLVVCCLVCLSVSIGISSADGEDDGSVSEETLQQFFTYFRNTPDKEFDGLSNYRDEDVLVGKIKLINRANNDFVSLLCETGSYTGVMSGNWQYIVPVKDGNSVCVYTFLKTENGIEFAATIYGNLTDDSLQMYLVDDAQIDDILQKNGFDRQSVGNGTYLMSYGYQTLFWAFTTDTGEYMIPFSNLQIDGRGYIFEADKVYSRQEVSALLGSIVWEPTTGDELLYGGEHSGKVSSGATSESDAPGNRKSVVYIFLAVIGIPLCIAVGVWVFSQKKTGRKN